MVKGQDYRRVLILAPSHHSGFRGLSIADADAFRTPLGDIPLDLEAVEALRASPLVGARARRPMCREHSIEIELPLLQRALTPGWRLVPVLVGRPGGSRLPGRRRPARDPWRTTGPWWWSPATSPTMASASTTCPSPSTPRPRTASRPWTQGAIARILAKDSAGLPGLPAGDRDHRLRLSAPSRSCCGCWAPGPRSQRIAYTTSGALTGDYDNSVSYAALVVTDPQPLSAGPVASGTRRPAESPRSAPRPPTGLAEEDLKRAASPRHPGGGGRGPGPADARDETAGGRPWMRSRAAARSPPGPSSPSSATGSCAAASATSSRGSPSTGRCWKTATTPPGTTRASVPCRPRSWTDLEIEVSVLTPPRPIASWEEFRVGEQGIILSKGGRRAVFLPEVAVEQGWTREETLSSPGAQGRAAGGRLARGGELRGLHQHQVFGALWDAVKSRASGWGPGFRAHTAGSPLPAATAGVQIPIATGRAPPCNAAAEAMLRPRPGPGVRSWPSGHRWPSAARHSHPSPRPAQNSRSRKAEPSRSGTSKS